MTIASPVNNAVILPGQPLTVVVDATDDVEVTAVALVCAPTFAGCESRIVQPAAPSTRQTFVVDIPATFQSTAGITLLATATDQAGNSMQLGRTVRRARYRRADPLESGDGQWIDAGRCRPERGPARGRG